LGGDRGAQLGRVRPELRVHDPVAQDHAHGEVIPIKVEIEFHGRCGSLGPADLGVDQRHDRVDSLRGAKVGRSLRP